MTSKEKGSKRLIRAITPEVDNDFFNMIDVDPKVIAARQRIEEANIDHRNRKTGNDRMQNQINRNIEQFKQETDILQKEKGSLEKDLSKGRGMFGRDDSCNNLQEQLRVLDEKIKIHDKKILNASTLSNAERERMGIFGFGGKRRKSLFKKSLFKKKRTKRRTKKRRSRKRRKTKRRIYKVRKTRRKLKGGLKKRWAKLKKKKAKRLSAAMMKARSCHPKSFKKYKL
jgi:hypothetical protein